MNTNYDSEPRPSGSGVRRLLLLLLLAQVWLPAQRPLYEVTAAGRPVEMHPFGGGAFGLFEVAQPAAIEIRAGFDVRWVDVRPRSAGIQPVISADHSTVRFSMTSPVPLTIEFNGDWKRVLHLFAYAPEKNAPKPDAAGLHYFGPGIHDAGIIELKDDETLYLAPGAWVKGGVRAHSRKNVRILGRGVLDGAGMPAGEKRNIIYLEKNENARIEGITIFNSPSWTVYLRNSRGTHIDGIRLLSWSTTCTTDGIDIVSSSDTLVENSFIRGNDDCIAIKNMDNIDQSNITVRRCVFWNMPCGNGVDIGFEMRAAKTSKVRIEDIDIIRVERGAVLAIHNGDSAIVEDILFDNIRVEDARHKLIDFAVVYGAYGPDRPTPEQRKQWSDPGGAWDAVMNPPPDVRAQLAKNRGIVRNVRVRNLQVVEGMLPFSIVAGYDKDHPVEGVVIENLTYQGQPIRTKEQGKFSLDFAPGFTIR